MIMIMMMLMLTVMMTTITMFDVDGAKIVVGLLLAELWLVF